MVLNAWNGSRTVHFKVVGILIIFVVTNDVDVDFIGVVDASFASFVFMVVVAAVVNDHNVSTKNSLLLRLRHG